MSEERAVLPKEVQPGYLVTEKVPKHTHTHTHLCQQFIVALCGITNSKLFLIRISAGQ